MCRHDTPTCVSRLMHKCRHNPSTSDKPHSNSQHDSLMCSMIHSYQSPPIPQTTTLCQSSSRKKPYIFTKKALRVYKKSPTFIQEPTETVHDNSTPRIFHKKSHTKSKKEPHISKKKVPYIQNGAHRIRQNSSVPRIFHKKSPTYLKKEQHVSTKRALYS